MGSDSSETEDLQRDTYADSFTALVNGILSNNTSAYRRAEETPCKGGVWLSNSASERILSLFNNYSDNTYSMNSDGYLTLEVAKSKPSKSLTAFYGDKINELIQSEKTVI